MVGGRLEAITAETVYKAAAQGDAVASEIVRDTARYLGAGIASLLNVLNADTISNASPTYATWLAPLAVVAPRLAKISITYDF